MHSRTFCAQPHGMAPDSFDPAASGQRSYCLAWVQQKLSSAELLGTQQTIIFHYAGSGDL
eukprot:6316317-Amphidinium_carterae.1